VTPAAELDGLGLGAGDTHREVAAAAVPPLLLTTCLITTSFGWTSLLVTVQVFV